MIRRTFATLRAHRAVLAKTALRLAVVALLVVAVMQILAPATYRLSSGYASFQLAPSLPGGEVIMPLGPAGVLRLDTHHTPVDLRVEFVLGESVPSLAEAKQLVSDIPALRTDAVSAFNSFLWAKVPWLIVFGALAGVLVANGGSGWLQRTLLHAAVGAGVMVVITGLFVGVTLLTADRTPAAHYQGLARNLPRVMALVREVGGDVDVSQRGVDDFLAGLERVAAELDAAASGATPGDVTRVLLVTDVHDNVVGMRIASSLLTNEDDPFSLVLLGGDLTVRGTAAEAALFHGQFSSNGLPVLMVGGNHEDRPAMKAFARLGYSVLDQREQTVAGLIVYGSTDPLAWSFAATPDQKDLDLNAATTLAHWQTLEPRPRVLLVHDLAQAQPIIEWAKEHKEELTVVYGHDHAVSLRREGTVTLVDGGSGGASGYMEVGRDPDATYTFQILEFSRAAEPRLLAVTTMRFTGLDGKSTAEYTPIYH